MGMYNDPGLLLGTEPPVMTLYGNDISFLSRIIK